MYWRALASMAVSQESSGIAGIISLDLLSPTIQGEQTKYP
jgi:hypothetical protein